jgi:hypothetical protein
MPTKRDKRIEKRAEAAAFLEEHSGPVMGMLVDVIGDLLPEVDGLNHFEQDAAFAAELAYRIDNAIPLGDPLAEALDGIIAFFVALAAVGIYRSIARREKLRGKRLDVLKERLEKKGPRMAKAAKFRLERRIKRLSS